MIKGTLYIISAPSGAGKSSLIRALFKKKLLYNMKLSISYTTRNMRPGEKNGSNYYFLDVNKFKRMIKNNFFIEYAYVFGNYYGTSRIDVEKNINNGVNLFLDIDWQGAQQICSKIPLTHTIFILPPSKKELLYRLYKRGQDKENIIKQRMKEFINEIKHFEEYEYIIINNNFYTALKDLQSIINSEHLRSSVQIRKYKNLIKSLITN